jgi:hypothetical protein
MIILIIYTISLIALLIIENVATDENTLSFLKIAILPIINTLTLLFIIGYTIKETYKYYQECTLDKEKEKPFYQFLNTRL